MSKNLLALDQASRTSGYAVFKDGQLIKYGHFTFDTPDLDKRLVQIKQEVLELIRQYDINEVVYEDIQLQNNVANNVQTFKALAEVFGVLSATFEEIGISHSTILAASWKHTLGIKGRSRADQKKNAQEYVRQLLQTKPTQDQADAVCIGLAHLKNSTNDWTD